MSTERINDPDSASELLRLIKEEGVRVSLQKGRDKNDAFMQLWGINDDRFQKIIRQLTMGDYNYSVHNEDRRLKLDMLHIFKHTRPLPDLLLGEPVEVEIYVKMGTININGQQVVVVSFHD